MISFQLEKKSFLFLLIGLFLILVASMRQLGLDNDSYGYIELIDKVKNYDTSIVIEPTFKIITYLSNFNERIVFFIYAYLAILIKILAIKRISSFPFLSIFTYISLYFVLHEMTQIRVGVAIGIFLLSIKDIYDRNFIYFSLKIIAATFFHYSAIVLIILYFLDPFKINRMVYFFIPIFIIIINIFLQNILLQYVVQTLVLIAPDFLQYKLNLILDDIYNDSLGDINIFNFQYLSFWIFYYIFLIKLDKLGSEYGILLFKLFSLSLFSFYLLSFVPVLAFRISNILGCSLIILLPMVLNIFKQKNIILIIIVIYLIMSFIVYSLWGLLNW